MTKQYLQEKPNARVLPLMHITMEWPIENWSRLSNAFAKPAPYCHSFRIALWNLRPPYEILMKSASALWASVLWTSVHHSCWNSHTLRSWSCHWNVRAIPIIITSSSSSSSSSSSRAYSNLFTYFSLPLVLILLQPILGTLFLRLCLSVSLYKKKTPKRSV